MDGQSLFTFLSKAFFVCEIFTFLTGAEFFFLLQKRATKKVASLQLGRFDGEEAKCVMETFKFLPLPVTESVYCVIIFAFLINMYF